MLTPKQISDLIFHATEADMPEGVVFDREDSAGRRRHAIYVGPSKVGALVMPPAHSSGPASLSVEFAFRDQEEEIQEMLSRIHKVMAYRRSGERAEARELLAHLARPIPAS